MFCICKDTMAVFGKHTWIWLILWKWQLISGQFIFTSSPGIQRTHEGNSVTLTWGLSSLEIIDAGKIYIGSTQILEYTFGLATYKNGYTDTKAPFTYDTTANTVSVRITSVNKNTDASQYSSEHTSSSTDGSTKSNNNAVIYVYGEPSGASITPSAPVVTEGNNLQLLCQSQSTSEPAAYRPDPSFTYRWYRDSDDITDSPPNRHSISGNQLTITGVQRGDSGSRYSCQSEETGGLQSDVSAQSTLKVEGQFIFTSSPGIQRTHEGNSVTLTWGLSSLEIIDAGKIYIGSTEILQYNFGVAAYKNGYTPTKAPFTYNTTANTVSVRITSVNKNMDAGQYSYEHTSSSTDSSTKTNNNAVIYVYGKPSGASITPLAPVVIEGKNLQFECTSQSTSEPAAYRPDPPLTYRWYRNSTDITSSPPDRHSISGNQLTITGVQINDSGSRYSCQSEETGGLRSDVSAQSTLKVEATPDRAASSAEKLGSKLSPGAIAGIVVAVWLQLSSS